MYYRFLRYTAAIAAVFLTFSAKEAKSQELLTLDQAIRIGLESNYSIRLARQENQIAENNLGYSYLSLLPNADARASTNSTVNDTRDQFANNEPRVVNNAKTNQASAGVFLNWTIFDGFGMFIDVDRLKKIEQSGELLTRVTVENTVAEIINSYYDVVRQAERIKSIQEAIAISQERVNITQAQYEVGVSAKVEILAARVDLNADRSALLRQEESLRESKITLNELLGRQPNLDFTVQDTILIDTSLQYGALTEQFASQNPALKRAQVNRDLAELDLRRVRAQRLPFVSLTGGYGYNRFERNPAFFGQTLGTNVNRQIGFNYGATVSIPILNGFTLRRQAQNAKVQIAMSDLQLRQLHNQLEAGIARAYSRYTNRISLLQLEEDNLLLARQNAEIALERYKLGLLTAIELREAQRNLLVAEIRLIDIQFEAKAAETELRRISSTLTAAGNQ